MTQPFDNQSPLVVAAGDATAEPCLSPAPGRDAPAPGPRAEVGGRVVGTKKAGRGHRAAPVAPRAPIRPAEPDAPADEDVPPFRLDTKAVAGAVGLAHEVSVLRAAIHYLAEEENAAPHVKTLAELRHQVEALCTALKTQQALDGRGDDLSADLARALEELGDELGVPR